MISMNLRHILLRLFLLAFEGSTLAFGGLLIFGYQITEQSIKCFLILVVIFPMCEVSFKDMVSVQTGKLLR
ncbi:MAG: hypothetical protein QOG71_2248 [Pyrinomonadaceae bacterium]|nr:hypothetical protein [Pyrinomonadaceae bacterium]